MGDSGILEFFLQILSAHALDSKFNIQILRLVGNSCADTGILPLPKIGVEG